MSTATRDGAARAEASRVELPARPAWLTALAADLPAASVFDDAIVALEVVHAADRAVLRATLRGADHRSDAALRGGVRRIYTRIGRWLDEQRLHPWRWWNYLPRIGAPAQLAGDRYQVSNVGRFEAFGSWSGGEIDGLAAASAVGHRGRDLVIDVLAGATPGAAIGNPRQREPREYSERFGPRPPCFARATLLPAAALGWPGERCALVAGTASIVGEDSVHAGDLDAQLDEIGRNLAALVPLDCYRALRAYVADAAAVETVAATLRRRVPAAVLELAVADLCREELLVEIEGLAVLDA